MFHDRSTFRNISLLLIQAQGIQNERYGWQYTSIMILGWSIYRYILVYTHTSIYQYVLDVCPTGQIHHPAVPVDQSPVGLILVVTSQSVQLASVAQHLQSS